MRLISSILTAISLLLLVVVSIVWPRSYRRYEGILHYGQGAPLNATAVGKAATINEDVSGRSTGLISYKGRLAYVSIANPLCADDWEIWSEPADAPPSPGAKRLAVDAARQSLGAGSSKTEHALEGSGMSLPFLLSYRYFTVPYWLLAMVLLLLPYRWFDRRRLLARRAREGRCLKCGHELVGGACPTCGVATA